MTAATPTELEAAARALGADDPRFAGPLTHQGPVRTFRVASPSGDLALKIFAEGEQDRATREAALLAHLAVDPPPYYRTPRLAGPLQPLAGALLLATRFEPGDRKRWDQFSDGDWSNLGASLATLHARLATYAGPLERLSDRLAARDLATERSRIEAQSEAARRHGLPAENSYFAHRKQLLDARGPRATALRAAEQPIHNDYNQHNFLFSLTAPPLILDWERAIAAPPEFEVVRCLNHLPIVSPDRAARFLDGYRRHRPLSPEALARAVDTALVEHALKHWPTEAWLAGQPWAAGPFVEHQAMVEALVRGQEALDRFFAVVA